MTNCPRCYGEGYHPDPNDPEMCSDVKCSKCNGTGLMDFEEVEK